MSFRDRCGVLIDAPRSPPEPRVEREADEPEAPLDPFNRYEHGLHTFPMKASNTTREKVVDCWGRWYWGDGSDY